MLRVGVSGGFTRVISLFLLCSLTTAMLVAASAPAEARRHRHHARLSSSGGYSPPYASIIVDANTGKTLYAVNENELRHPASITKVMTLYLLFEAMQAGRFQLDSPLTISANAARQEPSKLGLEPGETIEVEAAIKSIATKSANDIAVAVAENVGGSEERFVDMMNRKARQLGMTKTHYANPSGLPDPEQITTARDLSILGRAIQERFPKEYKYFATRNFVYEGRAMRNHNHLLGRVEGLDGIKTGYTRASGFNLLTSVRQDGRHIIGVVLGGRSAGARDAQMVALLDQHIERAYAGRSTSSVLAQADTAAAADDEEERRPAAPKPIIAPQPVVAPQPVAMPQPVERPKPAVVAELPRPKTASEQRIASAEPVSIRPQSGSTAAIRTATPSVTASVTPSAPSMRWITGPKPQLPPSHLAQVFDGRIVPPGAVPYTNSIAQQPVEVAENQPLPAAASEIKPVAVVEPAKVEPVKGEPVKAEPAKIAARLEAAGTPAKAKPAYTGWIIQLAATDNEDKAMTLLGDVKSRLRNQLQGAEPFTEKVVKGDTTLFRARFAGFEGDSEAQAACKAVKRAGFNCIAQKI